MQIKIRKADKLFSLYIRNRAKWRCERCYRKFEKGATQGLDCSHYHSRRKESVRFDPENASAHCMGCHMYFTQNPEEHKKWKIRMMGQTAFDKLTLRANMLVKRDDAAVELYYTKLLKDNGWL